MKTGDYIINFYNRYGAALKGLKQTSSEGCTNSIANGNKVLAEQAEAEIEAGCRGDDHRTPASFSVDRRVYNSLDKHSF